ncbi:hypothetical protein [Roseomonas marmotae]|uniref:Glycosyl transferase family 2 n=1 Tax=Roseomonas marmotae TaxID=2768161 RepID=A0ABS3K733_9PROT|nr:hypothetical protein [Roseomonas marmotae]MBO1073269.1 hypothetical protein [Roseomonas marmotae]QTI79110.1 hypothetical protein IAI58_15995 [Roseomonas marmotae]
MDATPRKVTTPIVIFSFDRPHYLRRFCESLRAQQGVELNERRIYMVQDGAVSPRSGLRYASDAVLEECTAIFRDIFPRGQVLASRENHGIAFNIRRGEALVFETLESDLGYFFEDDLELGPAYLLMMERLKDAVAGRPEVGYFAVYGEHRRPSDPAAPKLVWLDHHWGFALRRDAWQRISRWLEPYFDILARSDYQHRDHYAVFRFLQRQEMAIDRSSQDALKSVAAAQLGLVRVMTDLCFGRYIGEKGASFNPERYRELGYDRIPLITRTDIALPELTEERAQSLLQAQQEHYRRFRAREFDAFLAAYATRHWEADRLLSREDVDDLYRLLLDRLPESEAVYEQNIGRNTFRTLRGAILKSQEYRGRNPG